MKQVIMPGDRKRVSDVPSQRCKERTIRQGMHQDSLFAWFKMWLSEPTGQQRRWWEVRAVLWTVLLVVCVSGAVIGFLPEVRSSLRVTVVEPIVTLISAFARWEGWPALAFATFAGVFATPLLRRTRLGRSSAAN